MILIGFATRIRLYMRIRILFVKKMIIRILHTGKFPKLNICNVLIYIYM